SLTDSKLYLYAPPWFSGTAKFFNTAVWGSKVGTELNGTGSITLQSYNENPINVPSVRETLTQVGGTMRVDGAVLRSSPNQVRLASTITDAAIYGSIGFGSFGVNNEKGDPDVWMNVKH
ncbi:MAG TPA: hypothetical protein VGE40_01765, partial [Bacilli bacterium]